jgi:hypothetical protein
MVGAPARADSSLPRPPLRAETILLLAGLSLLLVVLALEPFLSYALFGSDTGEYYYLTHALVTSGTLPHGSTYSGWGTAYPDFPGTFLLAGAASESLGVGVFNGLTVVVPVVAALSVLPLFLLFRRLYPNDTVALLGAGFASVAMPRMFSLAHPAPLALGDFLCVGALWMLVESRRDPRWLVALAPISGALIVSHHLSSYFFVIAGLGGIVLSELWRPGLWSRRLPVREFAFFGAFVTATFAYWFYGTSEFVAKVLLFSLGGSSLVGFAAFEAFGLIVLGLAFALVRWRRSRARPRPGWVRLPTERSVARDALAIGGGVFVAASILIFVPIPGTSQLATPATVLWFVPVLGLGVLCAGSRRALTLSRLGPYTLTALGALGLSAAGLLLLATAGSLLPSASTVAGVSSAISPDRHVEYLFLPIGLLVAIGTGRLVALAEDRGGRRALVAGCVAAVVLLAANAAIVYPPQAEFGGFEEGLTHADAGVWMWVGLEEPTTLTVASDHRLSSMIFGFDHNPATWVTTPALFTGSNESAAIAELRSSGVPNPADARPIDLVVVDGVMYGGVALNPSAAALPLSAAAIAWFELPAFVMLYENGRAAIYLVDATLLP